MIRNIGSDLASFKALTFNPGLNILLADKSEGASDRQSRNGAGKTSLVELIHFLCGANTPKDSIARSSQLINSTFTIGMDIGDGEVTVARTGKKPSKLEISGSVDALPISPKLVKQRGCYEISNEHWKTSLGTCWFGIAESPDPCAKHAPSFRSLFSYFARRQESGGFHTPVKNSGQQQPWDQQVAISFLLGLNWRISSNLQGLKDKEKIIKGLAKAARSGDLGRFVGRSADLRTQLAVAERKSLGFAAQLEAFQVIPGYQELQSEANEITGRINELGEENFLDSRLVGELEESLTEEQEPKPDDLIRLYEEAGVLLPDMVCRRLDDARIFHRTIVENRRSPHLGAEITSASQRIQQREKEQLDLNIRRQQIMEILRSGGALEQYTAMREGLGRAQGEIENLRQRLTAAEDLERSTAELDIERTRLARALSDDIHEREDIVTMNSDVLPEAGYQNGFDVRDYVLPTKLTDATETGGLFGRRF